MESDDAGYRVVGSLKERRRRRKRKREKSRGM